MQRYQIFINNDVSVAWPSSGIFSNICKLELFEKIPDEGHATETSLLINIDTFA